MEHDGIHGGFASLIPEHMLDVISQQVYFPEFAVLCRVLFELSLPKKKATAP
jgi:hypothetical protein